MRLAIGEDLFEKIIEAKSSEWKKYSTHVTDWEVKKYLNFYNKKKHNYYAFFKYF